MSQECVDHLIPSTLHGVTFIANKRIIIVLAVQLRPEY